MKIVDLFSGAGGLTFGFYYKLKDGKFVKNKNSEIIFANEFDKSAAETFKKNFPEINMVNCDIKMLSEEMVLNLVGNNEVDLIIGGPPCQSYSYVGKRQYDDKAQLYKEYVRILSIIKPKMFLFENVKGMLSMKNSEGNLIINDIKERFANINDDLGYDVYYKILDAVDYGVPQHRERVFIIGIKKGLNKTWDFNFLKKSSDLWSLEDAISDFPEIKSGEEIFTYGNSKPKNEYQKLMRGDCNSLTCHFLSVYGDKIQTVMNHVVQGEGKDYINNLVNLGKLDEKYRLTSGYKNTYGRLYANQPCTTITHNMSTPSGLRCIHYQQNRALTPREGARIQSFPDWFTFVGKRSEIKTQIGNAVPPLLAMVLADYLEKLLK